MAPVQSQRAAGCGGLETEALVAGKLLTVEKHSPLIEFYGSVEEAEALLAEARLRLDGDHPARGVLEGLQEAVRLLPAVLAGAVEPSRVEALLAGLEPELPRPTGWSRSGCSLPDALVARAIAAVRRAERELSRAAGQGLVPRGLASSISDLASKIAYMLYGVRWLICGGEAAWSP